MTRAAIAALVVLAACRSLGGAGRGDPAKIEAQCVLVADGGICTFRNKGAGAAGRCVKILLGSRSGTVIASEPLCSGRLAAGGQMTVVVKFGSRPVDLCGDSLSGCDTRVVEPDGSTELATQWSVELRKSYTGPPTKEDCVALVKHRYDLYLKEDCGSYQDPQEKQQCVRDLQSERDSDLPYQVDDCMQYTKRDLMNCQLEAKTLAELDRCSDRDYD